MNVIITGASRGIGKAIAEAFARENTTLFLCARNKQRLHAAASAIQTAYPGCTVHTLVADLSKKTDAEQLKKWVPTADVLVNNAGQFIPGNIHDEPEGTLEKMIETNLYSAYYVTRALVPGMIRAGKGHIFNIASVAGLQSYENGGSYSISKFALAGFSKNLRTELMPYHIKVTTVYPGAVMTDSWGNFDNSDKRIMEAADIATMIVAASKLSPQAVVEEIILRPQLGDL